MQGLIDGGGPMGMPDYAAGPQRRIGGFGGFVLLHIQHFLLLFLPLAVFSFPSLLLILLYMGVTLNLIISGEVQLL